MSRYQVTYTAELEADSPEQAAEALRQTVATDLGCNYQISDLAYVAPNPSPVPGAFWVTPMTDDEVAECLGNGADPSEVADIMRDYFLS